MTTAPAAHAAEPLTIELEGPTEGAEPVARSSAAASTEPHTENPARSALRRAATSTSLARRNVAAPPPAGDTVSTPLTDNADAREDNSDGPEDNGGLPNSVAASSGNGTELGLAAGSPGGTGARGAAAGSHGHGGAAHGPLLRASRPCRGMFPASADDDVGVVTLSLVVGQEGVARRARILDEIPRKQGFAKAALSCVPSLSFDPATKDDGTRTAATSTVRLRFVRHL